MPVYSNANNKWQQFKRHRRGFISLLIFIILLLLSLCANFIANDKPLLLYYHHQLYFPVVVKYPETTFGGEFVTETRYRDPTVIKQINAHGWALWPPIRFRYDSINYASKQTFPAPPSTANWLGTDDNGRDVLSNILYGFRISLCFGFLLTLFASIIGIFFGALQGYYGGKIDLFGQRAIEIWSGMPMLFLIILLSRVVQPNFWWLLAISVLFGWMTLVGVVRAEFLRTRNVDYVRAAKVMGLSDFTIMFKHILPNAMVATLTYLPFILCGSIATLTSLDFLGFGLPLDSPSLGRLLIQSKNNLQAPWLGISTFILMATLFTLLIFIGEAVRDTFNPYKA